MRTALSLLFCLLFASPVACAQSIWDKAQNSVFKITYLVEDHFEGGSAFCAPNGNPYLVVTAGHVIDNAPDDVPLYDTKGNKHIGRVMFVDEERDVAVIILGDPACTIADLRWAKKLPEPGEPAIAVGYGDMRRGMLITSGIISGRQGIIDEQLFGVPAQLGILSGHSGCPVFDKQGKVVGMVVAMFGKLTFMDVIIPVNTLKEIVSLTKQ